MTRSWEASTGRTNSLVADSVGAALISLSWPILCASVAEILDAAVNVMWVGRELGDVSLAAVSNANLLCGLLFVLAFGVSMAGAVWVGRSLGKGDTQAAKAAVGTMVSASVAVSIICVLPMMIWTSQLLEVLGTPGAALSQGVAYLRTLLLSVPLMYLNGAVLAALQAGGDSKTGFYLSVVSVAIDAALNPLLIIGVWPIPALGIVGSALATLISQGIRLVALLIKVYESRFPLRLLSRDLALLRIDRTRAAALLRDGGPMAVQVLWTTIEEMLMISLVNRFGVDATAAYGAVVQIWNLIMMPAAALGVAITAIVAQNIGAGRWDRVARVTRLGLAYGVLATAALVILTEALGRYICGIFLPAGSLSLPFAAQINREATWSLILVGGYTVWVGMLRASGAVWVPLAISALVLTVRFPVTVTLLGPWHMHAIWWSFPASAAATSILAAFYRHWRRQAPAALSEQPIQKHVNV